VKSGLIRPDAGSIIKSDRKELDRLIEEEGNKYENQQESICARYE
jgi:hypothetical protein